MKIDNEAFDYAYKKLEYELKRHADNGGPLNNYVAARLLISEYLQSSNKSESKK